MTKFVKTEDGSLTLLNREAGELYHNSFGAFTEALENYTRPSSACQILAETGRLSILDACFGLGYNSWVTLNQLIENCPAKSSIKVTAVDSDPEIFQAASSILADSRLTALSDCLGRISQNLACGGRFFVEHAGGTVIELDILCDDLRLVASRLDDPFDLVFHDPFSPRKVPELWTVDLFKHYYRLLAERQGRVLTYSQAGAVRGGLKAAGFHLWRTTGVGKKAGGTLACLSPQDMQTSCVFALLPEQRKRLAGRSGIPYRDPQLEGSRESIKADREAEQAEMIV